MGMEIRLTLSLPRDRSTVPLTRRVLDAALGVFSVTRDCRDDIGLAVGEACANAVQHADLGADYQVTVIIHALADMVEFRRHQPHGVALRIVKMLTRVTTATA